MKLFRKILIVAIIFILTAGTVPVQEPSPMQAATKSARTVTRKIVLNKKKLTVEAGSSKKLSVKKLSGKTKITWKSSNTKVATVKNGKVKGISVGTATITASAGKRKATCKVTVVLGKEAKKAVKAYQKFMGQEYIDWGTDAAEQYRKISDFILVDINKDGIPELLVEAPGAHIDGYQAVYSYYKGKVVQSERQDWVVCYYPSSGVIALEKDITGGYQSIFYYKISNGKAVMIAEAGGCLNEEPDYFFWQGKELSKVEFDKKLKKVAGKKKVEIKKSYWHKNTSANRKKLAKLIHS